MWQTSGERERTDRHIDDVPAQQKGYVPRKSVALYAVEKEQSADEPGSVLCVAKCSSFIWMRRCRHILSFYPPTLLRGAIGRAALRRRFT